MQFSRFIPRAGTPTLPPYGAHDAPSSADRPRGAAPPDAITPYLGLRARLSQVWINKWTILILLVLVRLLIAVSSLDHNMASAEREALSACTSVESMGSAMASMPHYMSMGVNELTASGVEKAVNGLMSMLSLVVTGVEEIVLFIIHVLTSTYLCLITLVVRGSLHVALKIIEDTTEFLNKTLHEIGSGISKGVDGFQKEVNEFIKGINTVTSLFGDNNKIPSLDISGEVNKLNDLKLPSSINDGLDKINSSIPTFDEVQEMADTVIRKPFQLVKKLINETVVDYHFDRTLFPVPEREVLDFCTKDDGIGKFFDGLRVVISTAQKIFIGVLIVAAIAACVPMGYAELRRYRRMKERSLLVRKDAHDPMDVVYIISRPYTSAGGLKISSWFRSGRKQVLVRWMVAYVTSPPALFLLSLGIAGLFACLCQYLLLQAVKKEVPALTGQVSQFADKVVHSLNNASKQWATGTNGVIDHTNNDINQKVLGWVNQTTGPVNDTLNTFVEKTSDILDKAFGGTILRDPIQEVLHCLIGLKIEGIQKALTWVSDHAHVDFPHVREDMFSLGAIQSISKDNATNPDSFLANPGDKTADKISSVVIRVTDAVESGIKTEALISAGLICLWVFLLLIASIRVLTLAWRRDRVRGDGGIDAIYHPPAIGARAIPNIELNNFHDVPLNSPAIGSGGAGMALGAAPKYSATPNPPRSLHPTATSNEEDYQAQKLGYAGQRDYEMALQKDMRTSSHGQVEYGVDVKHG
ncbi:hypothetical protein MGYG_06869 [Nannizzia gypsea CBS 118893]|uniref:Plasma membrane fusion protein PRM1 n=1 Tax=Arthroderma gypseum (strain ATCC MYA-4604 / CBS 118893) TaxID=535722 RepID=E4V1F5_ARTGP|nr:hypothetical protein MGYG_06869 [Nannizzia gypsea CBS 118893]EFR03870.1 hypothetical protein MGYG_06869 [Nannizzia gypsea CBS 118893]